MTYHFAANISYLGHNYYGWQKQSHTENTIQSKVEQALSRVANQKITIYCAGRTDSGVHATNQIIHFNCDNPRENHSWIMGTNTYLPPNIRLNNLISITNNFHARFSAVSRRYQYIIEDNSRGNSILNQLVTSERNPLNVDNMHQAAQALLGEKDFSSFRAANCQSKTPFRHINFINISRKNHLIIVDIQANAFLYHMVRNIVGALLEIGRGKQSTDWINTLLLYKNRCLAPSTAPANGLYLVGVEYPKSILKSHLQYTPCPII